MYPSHRFPQPRPRSHHVRDDGGRRQNHAIAQLPDQAQEVEVQGRLSLTHILHETDVEPFEISLLDVAPLLSTIP